MNGPNAAGTRYLNVNPEGTVVAVLISAGGGRWSTTPGSHWNDWREELAFDPGLVAHILALQTARQASRAAARWMPQNSPQNAEIRDAFWAARQATDDYVENRWPLKDAPSGTLVLCPVEHLEVYWVAPGRSFTICDGEGSSESLLYLDEIRVLVP